MDKIFFMAAESSADMYAANLLKEIKNLIPQISFSGVGGNKVEALGVNLIFRSEELAVVGAFEVLSHVVKIRKALKNVVNWIKENNPSMILLFDFPDFNFMVIKKIRKFYKGKIVYIISPQVWAWREKRKFFIKKNVDKMIVILPFEKDIYREIGYEVEYLGHPLVDIVMPELDKNTFRERLGIRSNSKIITVFPGSRKKEISHHSKVLVNVIEELKKKYAHIEFCVIAANDDVMVLLKEYFKNSRVHLCKGYAYDAINASYIVIAKSGTVTLETALLEKPAIVFYKVNYFSYLIAKLLVKVPYISLPNLFAKDMIFPEFIQNDFNAQNIITAVERFLEDIDLYISTIEKLEKLKQMIGERGFFIRAAKKIKEWLNEK